MLAAPESGHAAAQPLDTSRAVAGIYLPNFMFDPYRADPALPAHTAWNAPAKRVEANLITICFVGTPSGFEGPLCT